MSEQSEIPGAARRRLRRRNSSLLILALGIFVFGIAASTLYYALSPVTLRIAVGPTGSDDVKVVQAYAQAFVRDGSHVRLRTITTQGAAESIALFTAGKADLAVARADLNVPTSAEAVAILRKNVVVLWAPSGAPAKGVKRSAMSKVKSIDDLPGHKVGVVGRTEANVTLLRVILTESGVNPDKVAVSQFAVNQIADLVRDPSLDAYMTVGPLDSKLTADAIAATAAARGEPKFLPIDVSEAIAQKHPLYESEEITGSIFSSSPARPEDKVETVGVNHLIVAQHAVHEAIVGALVRQLFTMRPQVAHDVPAAGKIEKPDTDKDATLPAHRGAAAYIDGTERTFMEKYSDYIWAGILLLSGVGSAGAWLRHYLRRNEREEYIDHRDNLLALISKVREAESAEELATMQAMADSLLREALDCYDDGAIEDGDLSVIGLTLEQFHHAVADRRAVIGMAAPPVAADADEPLRPHVTPIAPRAM
ncbi:TAXI family TRAP transporter solute-binding subunit [Bradyrhizobium jicamae]|uniref:TAXI family TRAP transporter solute-binding subunit n=1 Tax=Bradyrhizobium jicamae TaxID=280332 RepID=A0ABS5FE49_9BRAD|nr:TAXI family TRAP transporter solute-binding subunit [Bradyrhizobium jicamae]MBR0795081.1 TAXI family TRAP transporter solute-binding subunit [Bradyrhizobium jicamae]MBR0936955.1 TAXI family TRAP transporter solute-binding subunit [Bradyrhizobium jicamae]